MADYKIMLDKLTCYIRYRPVTALCSTFLPIYYVSWNDESYKFQENMFLLSKSTGYIYQSYYGSLGGKSRSRLVLTVSPQPGLAITAAV